MDNEIIEYKGVKYYRYPNSEYNTHRNYFRSSKRKELHRVIWEDHKGKIPIGFHIHHKDGNSLNNNIENLECLTPKQHSLSHMELGSKDPSKDIHEPSRRWHKSEQGMIHHKKIWEIRTKTTLFCSICEVKYERYNCGILKDKCNKCRKYIKKGKKISIKKEKHKFPESECEICKNKIIQLTIKPKRFCSKKCKAERRRRSGVDNESRNCLICSKLFVINRFSPTKTCSWECRNKYITIKSLNAR